MIKLISKVSGKVVEQINEQDFRIDKDKIYGKDEFGNEVYFERKAFYATKECYLTITKGGSNCL